MDDDWDVKIVGAVEEAPIVGTAELGAIEQLAARIGWEFGPDSLRRRVKRLDEEENALHRTFVGPKITTITASEANGSSPTVDPVDPPPAGETVGNPFNEGTVSGQIYTRLARGFPQSNKVLLEGLDCSSSMSSVVIGTLRRQYGVPVHKRKNPEDGTMEYWIGEGDEDSTIAAGRAAPRKLRRSKKVDSSMPQPLVGEIIQLVERTSMIIVQPNGQRFQTTISESARNARVVALGIDEDGLFVNVAAGDEILTLSGITSTEGRR